MRLVCPKCSAQYEVDDGAIPDAGRNVQCANCGDTWFQASSKAKPNPAPEPEPARVDPGAEIDPPVPVQTDDETTIDEPTSHPIAEEAEEADGDLPEDDSQDQGPRAGISHAEQAASQAPRVDPTVLDILRKEAEIEAAARQNDATQAASNQQSEAVNFTPDLTEGTPEDAAQGESLGQRARALRNRVTRERNQDRRLNVSTPKTAQTENGGVAAAPKRGERVRVDQLPDIDELNSTLRSAKDRSRPSDGEDEIAAPTSGGRERVGFYLAVLITLLALAAYQLDRQIIEAVPKAEPYMIAYVDGIDKGRIWLNDMIDIAIDAGKNLTGS